MQQSFSDNLMILCLKNDMGDLFVFNFQAKSSNLVEVIIPNLMSFLK